MTTTKTFVRADRLYRMNLILSRLWVNDWVILLTFPAPLFSLVYYCWCFVVDPDSVSLFERRIQLQIRNKVSHKK